MRPGENLFPWSYPHDDVGRFLGCCFPQVEAACINLRLPTFGGFYVWEFEKGGKEAKVRVEGPLAFNSSKLVVEAALAGCGLACVLEDRVKPHVKNGNLIRVLADWCPPFSGYYLYYPSRRQPTPAFNLLVDALRHRS